MIDTDRYGEPDLDKAADAALELMKQLITLSSGVLALSATFLDKFRVIGVVGHIPLLVSWLLLVAAIVFALDVVSAIVKTRLKPEYPWYDGRGKRSGSASKWCFVSGIVFFGIFALTSVTLRRSDTDIKPLPSTTIFFGNG